jgi:hypothetical protein
MTLTKDVITKQQMQGEESSCAETSVPLASVRLPPKFAVYDQRLQGLLGAMVSGRNGHVHQKQQPRSGMNGQVLGETRILRVPTRTLRRVPQVLDMVLMLANNFTISLSAEC